MTSQEVKYAAKRITEIEKEIKVLVELQKVLVKMNKLNGAFNLDEILITTPKFADEFMQEVRASIRNKKELIEIIIK